uniref:Uncharacterized protein n=1 Tax=Arundo donax TaxID=35708 RepID=A0A0A9A6N4_ARUDO
MRELYKLLFDSTTPEIRHVSVARCCSARGTGGM